MKRLVLFCLVLCSVLLAGLGSITAFAQEITDLSILKQGGYILFFRHASAPGGAYATGGTGNDGGGSIESQWWKSCDPATARQLSTIGRQEAAIIGRVMRQQNMRVGRLITSEYCRAYESAVLMNMNVNLQFSTAATFGLVFYPDAERVVGLRNIIAQAPITGTNTVVWTHGTSQGEFNFNIQWSDAVVYKYNTTSGTSTLVGTLPYQMWAKATTATSVAASTLQQESDLTISVSPNPSAERVLVQVGKQCDISILNMLGREMYSEADFKGARSLDVSSWASGTYIITAGTASKRVTRKFTKF
jgi:phosphohistidine phosphatase SixA